MADLNERAARIVRATTTAKGNGMQMSRLDITEAPSSRSALRFPRRAGKAARDIGALGAMEEAIRADQTQRIVEWLRARQEDHGPGWALAVMQLVAHFQTAPPEDEGAPPSP